MIPPISVRVNVKYFHLEHADILFLTHKGAPFARLVMRTITTLSQEWAPFYIACNRTVNNYRTLFVLSSNDCMPTAPICTHRSISCDFAGRFCLTSCEDRSLPQQNRLGRQLLRVGLCGEFSVQNFCLWVTTNNPLRAGSCVRGPPRHTG